MKKILNVQNHSLTVEQVNELANKGFEVIELPEHLKKEWGNLTPDNYLDVVVEIWLLEHNNEPIMNYIVSGFSPAVAEMVCMSQDRDIYPIGEEPHLYYAYSQRESVEVEQEDGTVIKKSVFKHKGFYRY